MRKLMLFSMLVAAAVIPGCSCGKNSSSSGSSSSTSAVDSKSETIAVKGGVIEYKGARFEFAAGSLAGETKVVLKVNPPRPAPVDRLFKLVSASYTLEAGVRRFERPVKVTIPFDPSLLPEGVKAAEVVPVLGSGGVYEPLHGGKVDVDRREVTFELSRLDAHRGYDGIDPGPLTRDVEVGVAGSWASIALVRDDPEMELRAAPARIAQVEKKFDILKATLARARREYAAMGFLTISKVQVGFVGSDRIGTNRAETRSDDLTLINETLLDEPESELVSTFTHECFHLVQFGSSFGMECDAILNRWPDESTATWMQYKLCGDSQLMQNRCVELEVNDFQSPVFRETTAWHPYYGFTFWCFIDDLYGALPIIRQVYMKPGEVPAGFKPAADHVALFDRIFRATPDRLGRRRGLDEVLIDYLDHYACRKDKEPFKTVLADARAPRLVEKLGGAGSIKFNAASHVRQSIPFVEGSARKRKRRLPRSRAGGTGGGLRRRMSWCRARKETRRET